MLEGYPAAAFTLTSTMLSLFSVSTVNTLGAVFTCSSRIFCSLLPKSHSGLMLNWSISSTTIPPEIFDLPLSISAVEFLIPSREAKLCCVWESDSLISLNRIISMGSSFFIWPNYSEFEVNIKIIWKYSLFLEKFHIFESINTLINSKLCKGMKFGGLKIGNFPKTVKRTLLAYFIKHNKNTTMKTILIYDGSFAGFLTAVYQVFDQ